MNKEEMEQELWATEKLLIESLAFIKYDPGHYRCEESIKDAQKHILKVLKQIIVERENKNRFI